MKNLVQTVLTNLTPEKMHVAIIDGTVDLVIGTCRSRKQKEKLIRKFPDDLKKIIYDRYTDIFIESLTQNNEEFPDLTREDQIEKDPALAFEYDFHFLENYAPKLFDRFLTKVEEDFETEAKPTNNLTSLLSYLNASVRYGSFWHEISTEFETRTIKVLFHRDLILKHYEFFEKNVLSLIQRRNIFLSWYLGRTYYGLPAEVKNNLGSNETRSRFDIENYHVTYAIEPYLSDGFHNLGSKKHKINVLLGSKVYTERLQDKWIRVTRNYTE